MPTPARLRFANEAYSYILSLPAQLHSAFVLSYRRYSTSRMFHILLSRTVNGNQSISFEHYLSVARLVGLFPDPAQNTS